MKSCEDCSNYKAKKRGKKQKITVTAWTENEAFCGILFTREPYRFTGTPYLSKQQKQPEPKIKGFKEGELIWEGSILCYTEAPEHGLTDVNGEDVESSDNPRTATPADIKKYFMKEVDGEMYWAFVDRIGDVRLSTKGDCLWTTRPVKTKLIQDFIRNNGIKVIPYKWKDVIGVVAIMCWGDNE